MDPKVITEAEWQEIASVPEIRDAWGLDGTEKDGFLLSSMAYGSRYDFISGSPGYAGDLFVIVGDSGETPVVLNRENGKLVVQFDAA